MKTGTAVRMLLLAGLLAVSACDGGADRQERPESPAKTKSFDELIADSSCMACHLPDNQMGVPSWEEVAKRYRGGDQKAAEAHLMDKIAHGGSGVWGKMDMPPYPELCEADLRVMVRGILARGSAKANGPAEAQKK